MPLPENQQVVETADQLVKAMRGAFGTPEAYRPGHAKGRLVKGFFTPTPEAATLSKAPHLNNPSTPVLVRFSNSTGIPTIPDTDSNANPRGMGIRFLLGDNGHRHTDIVAHSTAFFPMSTGEGFLKMLEAIGNGSIGKFLEENPSAAAHVYAPKPFPASFVTERYFGVNAFKFVSVDGGERFIRYRVVPEEYAVLEDSDVASKSDSYLADELAGRLSEGPVKMKLVAQVAAEDDVTNDCTVHWPEDRKLVVLGSIELEEMEEVDESKKDEKQIILDPIPRVEGIEPSEDPLLDMRAAVYLLSGRGRRAAPLE